MPQPCHNGQQIESYIIYGNDLIVANADRIIELEMQEAKLLEKLARQGSALS